MQSVDNKEKVVALFQFIREMNRIKQDSIKDIRNYPWHIFFKDIPSESDNIVINYRDRVEDEDVELSDIIMSVHKPEFQKCPSPDDSLLIWLEDGWDDYHKDAVVKESISFDEDVDAEEKAVGFSDNEERVALFEKWNIQRKEWQKHQVVNEKTRDLFTDLYRLYFDLKRDEETMEIVSANGMLQDALDSKIYHPVVTCRVKLEYNAKEDTIFILSTDSTSEIYSNLFQGMEDINLDAVNRLMDELAKNEYDPLDRNALPAYLKILVYQLSSSSIYSDTDIPDDWKDNNRLLMYFCPCFILRKRLDGTLKAIEKIIENVSENGYVPGPISDIVSGGQIEIPERDVEETVEESLAAVGGESVEILLSKEANKEQLEIARRIENYNAVLVQGPPGTGKTHTIANLMGHFLAQGKSVLVTSYTTKALKVLKDKVSSGLSSLCVSVIDDSNVDMERSIDGITAYMSSTTSFEIKKEMDALQVERKDIIEKLASTRKKIFSIINKENGYIVYDGESISPTNVAKFVVENEEELSYIPGEVKKDLPLPLTFEQLKELYRSNEVISTEIEVELDCDLPNPDDFIDSDTFASLCRTIKSEEESIKEIADSNGWNLFNNRVDRTVSVEDLFKVSYPNANDISALRDYIATFVKIEEWMKYAAVDGKNGGAYRDRWEDLIFKIEETCESGEQVVAEQFRNKVIYDDFNVLLEKKTIFEKIMEHLSTKGKITKLTLTFHKDFESALKCVTVNEHQINSADECKLVLNLIKLFEKRIKCAEYWDELIAKRGVPTFLELDENEPERIALKWIKTIERYLDWYKKEYSELKSKVEVLGISLTKLVNESDLDSDLVATEKILNTIEKTIPALCSIFNSILTIENAYADIKKAEDHLSTDNRINSNLCKNAVSALEDLDAEKYENLYNIIYSAFDKYRSLTLRREYLKVIEEVAPEWAKAIDQREGIHGESIVPNSIEDAWKWKQFSIIVKEILSQPFSELQNESLNLSKEYRKVTAKYAEKCGWYHLLKKTEADIDMKQALQGWKMTTKKIGKGTGKLAPAMKAKARELMAKCQEAVPCWIMPINKALESLDPSKNRFDVIIIDEASQSDVSSLSILYMGKKLIVVGDDKQVSPMAIGTKIDKMNSLQEMYIKDKIPNYHLYSPATSIYDIAATTFQPLMLREHFRCTPDIIGFSNMLSYDYKIKPLRDVSNNTIQPSVVNYRVRNGNRVNKTNPMEAKAIVALMKACIEQEEYKGKTFGIISLLGDEQVKIIQREIDNNIDAQTVEERNILCGNSAHFQGDERDVIFLSLVDSGTGNGPLNLQGFGVEDSTKKRYNVAASRAKDQLWVINSLDPANDLKSGDIRRTLIEYAINPRDEQSAHAEVEQKADSPFEVEVVSALKLRGYNLVQQWKVGAYRLDIVAVCGNKTVAIECDGERWHSGEAKVREDMERQTILERLGWRFIRIRGSEYYRNKEKTIERVVSELTSLGIEPESQNEQRTSQTSDLLNRVKKRAAFMLYGEDEQVEDVSSVIEHALNSRTLDNVFIDSEEDLSVVEMVESEIATAETMDNPETATVEIIATATTSDGAEAENIVTSIQADVTVDPVIEKVQSEDVDVKDEIQSVDIIYEPKTILEYLEANNLEFIDKRSVGGALWVLGDESLKDTLRKAKRFGLRFKYKEEGGKVSKGESAWWAKDLNF